MVHMKSTKKIIKTKMRRCTAVLVILLLFKNCHQPIYSLGLKLQIPSSRRCGVVDMIVFSGVLSVVSSSTTDIGFVYRSYQNSAYCNASSKILYPANAEELQAIIKSAAATQKTVKVIGSRHSLTDIICTDGIPISTVNINYTIVNSGNKATVTVGSGAELKDVLDKLQESNLTLIHVPAFGGITIGGALGTGAHGSSLLHPTTISDQVVQMTIIDGLGEFRTLRKDTNPEELKAFRVHLGLLGAIVNVTLETVPLFKMKVFNYVDSENILLNGTALADARSHDWYQLWWFPSSQSTVVSKGTYVNTSVSGNASTNLIPDIDPNVIGAVSNVYELCQALQLKNGEKILEAFTQCTLHQKAVGKPPVFTETDSATGDQVFTNPAVGYAHRLQSNRCSNKCAWDNGDNSILPEESAMAFSVEQLPNVVVKIKEILKNNPARFMMIGVFIRFSKASDAFMSFAHGRDTVSVEWTTPMRKDPYTTSRSGIGAYQAILQSMVSPPLNGRAHWGKNGGRFFTRETLLGKYPNMSLFKEMMKSFDPNEVFMNRFGKRILFESDMLSMDPRVNHCALQDYCMCRINSDCANLQQCRRVSNNSNVCVHNLPELGIEIPKGSYDVCDISSILNAIQNVVSTLLPIPGV